MKIKPRLAIAFGLAQAGAPAWATDLVIATVNNGHMIEMQKLTPHFEKAYPDIKLKWVTLEEGVLRQRVTTDIATKGGLLDLEVVKAAWHHRRPDADRLRRCRDDRRHESFHRDR